MPAAVYKVGQLRDFRNDPYFRRVQLHDRRSVTFSNGVPAELLTFSCVSPNERRVRQAQLLAVVEDRSYFMTFTTLGHQFRAFDAERTQAFTSFKPG